VSAKSVKITRILDEKTSIEAAEPSVVVIGNFDGVHRGHQAVLEEAVREAKARSLVPSVLTFHPHPAEVLGRGAPPMLTNEARRAELIGELGVERVFIRTFDQVLAEWTPEQFARQLLLGTLNAKIVVVGENFRFGHNRAGDRALLQELGEKLGFEARAHAIAADAKGPFSSSRVRDAIAAGDVIEAAAVLGRPHSFAGTVGQGAQRGRRMGYPTANIEEIREMVPASGVYVVRVSGIPEHDGELMPGVMNVGVRPTVAATGMRTVEVHVIDFNGDLYGKALRVHVQERLREEKKFDGVTALKAQIALDLEAARAKTRGET
jgi:riboflavin kinase/FMN adenylyltransferase